MARKRLLQISITGGDIDEMTAIYADSEDTHHDGVWFANRLAELGVLEREITRVRNGSYVLIPASEETQGHRTTHDADLWKDRLAELLATAPDRSQ